MAAIELERVLALTAGPGPFFSHRAAGYLAMAYTARQDYPRAAATLAAALDESTPMETQGQRIVWLTRAELALAEGQAQQALVIAEQLIASLPNAAEHQPGCVPVLW